MTTSKDEPTSATPATTPTFETVPNDPAGPASDISATYGRDGNQAVDAFPDDGALPAESRPGAGDGVATPADATRLASGHATSDVSATYGRDGNQAVDAQPDSEGTSPV